jgi:pimeloyl-ACP methyl ester carboxylesterase
VTETAINWLDLPAGRFRALEWPGSEPSALFLHGLTGVAEVWKPTIDRLAKSHRRCVAIDQRGHGQSPKPVTGHGVGSFVGDVIAAIDALELDTVHLVGHSMGARVAMVAAARYPARFHSVAIVDIGPEAWRANWEETVAAFEHMPTEYASIEEATSRRALARGGESIDSALASSSEMAEVARARFRVGSDGRARWWADVEALKQTVKTQRSRGYWNAWRALRPPALFIRGGESHEVRPAIAARMRRENPAVSYLELEGVGHNIPLLAPGRLAEALGRFWAASGT